MKNIIIFVLFVALSTIGIATQANDHKSGRQWQHDRWDSNYADRFVGYRSDRAGRYSSDKHHSNQNWVSKGRHRTHKNDSVNRHIAIGGRISAIRITAAKRNTYIREAWVEYGNGRLERIAALEGRLSLHKPMKVRLRNKHNVRKLHLKVKSRGRHRGYFDVDVRRTS
jgi:hypothetical protein